MDFRDPKLPAFNTKKNYVEFSTVDEAWKWAQKNGIGERQEFWFSVGENLFNCLFESIYEG